METEVSPRSATVSGTVHSPQRGVVHESRTWRTHGTCSGIVGLTKVTKWSGLVIAVFSLLKVSRNPSNSPRGDSILGGSKFDVAAPMDVVFK